MLFLVFAFNLIAFICVSANPRPFLSPTPPALLPLPPTEYPPLPSDLRDRVFGGAGAVKEGEEVVLSSLGLAQEGEEKPFGLDRGLTADCYCRGSEDEESRLRWR